jgi:predicted PurR-regulated permease PerM
MSDREPLVKSPTRVLVGLAAVAVIIGGMKLAAPVLVPFLLSAVIATILIPPLNWLVRHHLPLSAAMLVLSLGLIVVWLPAAAIVGASFDDFYAELPAYQARVQALMASILEWLGAHGAGAGTAAMRDLLRPSAALSYVGLLGGGLGAALTNILLILLILLTVIFMLFEASDFPAKLNDAFGGRDGVLMTFREFSTRLQEYLRIKTLVSLLTGGTIALWLWLVGLDFPLLWGVIAFLLNYVPNIGSIIAAVPAVLLALVALDWTGILLVIGGYIGVNLVFGNILEPRLMGRGLGLSTLVVFLSLLFWGWVLGPVGMLLSGPLTMMIKIALETDPRTRWFAVLLGPAPQPGPATEPAATPDAGSLPHGRE